MQLMNLQDRTSEVTQRVDKEHAEGLLWFLIVNARYGVWSLLHRLHTQAFIIELR